MNLIYIQNNFLQNVFAKLEERDWVLINESKRPHLIAAPNRNVSSEEQAAEPGGQPSVGNAENVFQIVVMAKGGIGLSLVSKNPSEELLYAFMSFVVVDYQSSASHRFKVRNLAVSLGMGHGLGLRYNRIVIRVTRLGYLLKISASKFVTKVAQIFGDFWGAILNNGTF